MSPETFWTMTLTEWRAALRGFALRHGAGARGGNPMRHAELLDLMRQYPDA